MKNVYIIGAGPSGLITARELLKEGFKFRYPLIEDYAEVLKND